MTQGPEAVTVGRIGRSTTRLVHGVLGLVLLAPILLGPAPSPARAVAQVEAEEAPHAEVPSPQETQAERDARVADLLIAPGHVTVPLDGIVIFSALPRDAAGSPVGGVAVAWRAEDLEREVPAPISPTGEFRAASPGTFRVTARVPMSGG